jgi:hypothetical protein
MLDATDVIIVILVLVSMLGIAQWYHYKNKCDQMERQLRRIRRERMRNA